MKPRMRIFLNCGIRSTGLFQTFMSTMANQHNLESEAEQTGNFMEDEDATSIRPEEVEGPCDAGQAADLPVISPTGIRVQSQSASSSAESHRFTCSISQRHFSNASHPKSDVKRS
jgi:hypothetical protein